MTFNPEDKVVAQQSKPRARGAGTLVSQVSSAIRESIRDGQFSPGDKLPSEARLTEAHNVSRTVIREAVAALRSDGLVEARQGAGVFVLVPPTKNGEPQKVVKSKLFSILELLELRTPVEVEAAGLAAQRRSPAQEELILTRHSDILICIEAGQPIRREDFQLHLAIAEATNNPLFGEFLHQHGNNLVPKLGLKTANHTTLDQEYFKTINQEHEHIVTAISDGDEKNARESMLLHLKNSQVRHRAILKNIRMHNKPLDGL